MHVLHCLRRPHSTNTNLFRGFSTGSASSPQLFRRDLKWTNLLWWDESGMVGNKHGRVLLQCAGPRCHHLLRTLPPSQSLEYAVRHHEGMVHQRLPRMANSITDRLEGVAAARGCLTELREVADRLDRQGFVGRPGWGELKGGGGFGAWGPGFGSDGLGFGSRSPGLTGGRKLPTH